MRALPPNFYNPLPNASQTLLLKACLLDNDQAIPCWEKWMSLNGFDKLKNGPSSGILPQVYDPLDFSSQRLLALLYKKMSGAGIQHPLINSLKGYYRYIWVRNQLLKDQLRSITELLTINGIVHMVIKGFPMIEAYYKDFGARSVLDLDIIVHPDYWEKALAILLENGWKNKDAQYLSDAMPFSLVHGTHLVKELFEVDLHIRFHDLPLKEQTINSFWSEAVVYKPDHKMLCPEHQLINSFIHGYVIEGDSVIRTITDATYIIKNTPGFDWSIVTEVIQQNNLQIPAKVLLEYLHHEGFCTIPANILDSVQRYSLVSKEAKYFRLLTTPDVGNGYKLIKLRLSLLSLMNASVLQKGRILINTYKYQWGADSLLTLLYRTGQVMLDKFKSPNKPVVTRRF